MTAALQEVELDPPQFIKYVVSKTNRYWDQDISAASTGGLVIVFSFVY